MCTGTARMKNGRRIRRWPGRDRQRPSIAGVLEEIRTPDPRNLPSSTEVARSERFELPTLGIEIRCSIQLSYERIGDARRVDFGPGRSSLSRRGVRIWQRIFQYSVTGAGPAFRSVRLFGGR